MTDAQFKVIFSTKLVQAFPNTEVNKFTTKLFWDYFKEIPPDKFSDAVHIAIMKSKFFPTVNDLIKCLDEVAGILSFEETYSKIDEVNEEIRKTGSWSSKNYPEIVSIIIERSGHIEGVNRMSADEKHRIIKKNHNNIVQELRKKSYDVKKLQ